MAFKNTVETVGDAALTRSIIDRSITELNCNITTSIRQYAFRACTALASVNFPSVTSVANGAFYGCTALAKADFASPVAFENNAFYGCSALTALILRNTEQISTITGTPFAASAIASGTGYIYVPAALVDQYKASWTTYAAQIRAIEDYSHIVDPYTWDAVAKNINAGTYASVYKVGDLVPLDLGTEGEVNMQIAGFDVDDLADGSGKAPISWISKELLKTSKRWNPAYAVGAEGTGTIGGWEKSELRAYYNDTLLPLIPKEVRDMIKDVAKTHDAHDTAGASYEQTTSETIWPPSKAEVAGASSLYFDLFKDTNGNRKKARNGESASTGRPWWLRSANSTGNAHDIYQSGTAGDDSVTLNSYLALCFCT